MILNERVEVDVLAPSLGQALIENLGRLARGLSPAVGLERPLDDFGHGSFLAPRERMREVARSGAADGKLRLGHGGILSSIARKDNPALACHQAINANPRASLTRLRP